MMLDKQSLELGAKSGVKLMPALTRLLLLLAFANIVLSLLFYALSDDIAQRAFPLISGMKMLPPFADLRWATSLSECGVDLQALAEHRLWGCDPYGRGGGLGYPPMSVQFARFLAVKGQHTGWLGLSMGLALVSILMGLTHRLIREPIMRDLVASLLLLSFPLQLAVERGNIDVILFVLLASLSSVLACSRAWTLPVVVFLAWLMVAVKAYPLVGLFGWVGLGLLRRLRLDAAQACVLLGASLGLATIVSWLFQSGQTAAQPGVGLISHGLRTSLPHIAPLGSGYSWLFSGLNLVASFWTLFMLLLGLLVGLRSGLNRFFLLVAEDIGNAFSRKFVTIFISMATCVWLGCYILTTSFDYRLIYALPGIIVLILFLASSSDGRFRSLLSGLLFVGVAASLLGPLAAYSVKTGPIFFAFSLRIGRVCDLVVMPIMAGMLVAMLVPAKLLPVVAQDTRDRLEAVEAL